MIAVNNDISRMPGDIVTKFEELALEVAARGYSRYSARTILHRLRWHFHIEQGSRDFKCNDHWSPTLARWFMDQHPEYPNFFETRSPVRGSNEL